MIPVADLPVVTVVINYFYLKRLGQALDVLALLDQEKLRQVFIVFVVKENELGLVSNGVHIISSTLRWWARRKPIPN